MITLAIMPVLEMTTVFQPIVELASRRPVAYEALSRMPSPAGPAFPAALFDDARAGGWIAELDETCWRASLKSAAATGLTDAYALFVNVEAESLRRGLVDAVPASQRVVIEITERSLLSDPGELLAMIDRARRAGHAIAIDDLGADPASLALLPLIDPDVVKVDMHIVQGSADDEVARVMSVLNTLAASRDVVIIAEGIETEDHLLTARALGATHGQGWLFGRPAATPWGADERGAGADGLGLGIDAASDQGVAPGATPFSVVAAELAPRRSARDLLLRMSVFLEARAQASGDSAIVLATFQEGTNLTARTAARYRALAEHCALVMTYVDGPAPSLHSSVRVHRIIDADELRAEWDIVVLTADFAAALVAREVDPADHSIGTYDFVLTHDRRLAVAAARSLLLRTAPPRLE